MYSNLIVNRWSWSNWWCSLGEILQNSLEVHVDDRLMICLNHNAATTDVLVKLHTGKNYDQKILFDMCVARLSWCEWC